MLRATDIASSSSPGTLIADEFKPKLEVDISTSRAFSVGDRLDFCGEITRHGGAYSTMAV